jgi:hypothetical protein
MDAILVFDRPGSRAAPEQISLGRLLFPSFDEPPGEVAGRGDGHPELAGTQTQPGRHTAPPTCRFAILLG